MPLVNDAGDTLELVGELHFDDLVLPYIVINGFKYIQVHPGIFCRHCGITSAVCFHVSANADEWLFPRVATAYWKIDLDYDYIGADKLFFAQKKIWNAGSSIHTELALYAFRRLRVERNGQVTPAPCADDPQGNTKEQYFIVAG